MLKVVGCNVVISKGYENKPALNFYGDSVPVVRFRIGKPVYDKNAEGQKRWINFSVKAFGPMCEKIQKMKLDAGSWINISGKLDKETWDDNGQKREDTVITIEDVEFAYSGTQNNVNNQAAPAVPAVATPQAVAPQPYVPPMPTAVAPQAPPPTPTPAPPSGVAEAPPPAPDAAASAYPQSFAGNQAFDMSAGANMFLSRE